MEPSVGRDDEPIDAVAAKHRPLAMPDRPDLTRPAGLSGVEVDRQVDLVGAVGDDVPPVGGDEVLGCGLAGGANADGIAVGGDGDRVSPDRADVGGPSCAGWFG